jgi:hypothetical protein
MDRGQPKAWSLSAGIANERKLGPAAIRETRHPVTSITSSAAGLVQSAGGGRAGSLWARQAPALAAKSARISMTDKVVDFQSGLAARKVEYAEYDKRMQHLGRPVRDDGSHHFQNAGAERR